MKRMRSTARARSGFAASAALVSCMVLAQLSACAPLPVAARSERLDSGTGTTLAVMPRPVELIIERRRDAQSDPFAYLAPFETNRMGTHDLYLWVAAPRSVAGSDDVPEVFCGDERVALEPITANMEEIGLSSPPYAAPAPWSEQWYFRVPRETLACLSGASRISVVRAAPDAAREEYSAEAESLSGLTRFLGTLAQSQPDTPGP